MRGTGRAWGVTLAVSALAAAALAVALAGCVPGAPTPVPTEASSGEPNPSASPDAPLALNLDGTATDNLKFFNKVNHDWVDSGGATDGRSLIDNLVAAGFPKQAMEVTPDRTTVNAQADEVMYSVRLNGTCLIGQFGEGAYSGTAQPLLSSGKCLIGITRPIDW